MKKTLALWCLLASLSGAAIAADEIYPFTSPVVAQQFKQLTGSLRCLVCQNQTLADSSAPLAIDLRQQIYNQLAAGHSPQQVRDYLIARYGNFILYKPPFNRQTALLWCSPLLLLSIGTAYLLFYLSRNKRRERQHGNAI
jgi:cytochrome c-type biogenesis protein CcmH